MYTIIYIYTPKYSIGILTVTHAYTPFLSLSHTHTLTQTADDILLRDELDKLAEDYPDRFSVWYTVDRPEEGKQPHTHTHTPHTLYREHYAMLWVMYCL